MKKKIRTKPSLVPSTEKTEVIPKDLEDKVTALRALTGTLELLCNFGHFPFNQQTKLSQSVAFIDILHKQMYEEAVKHPQAFMVPGLLPKTNNQDGVQSEETKESATV